MPPPFPISRSFLSAGITLAVISLVLWWALPINLALPPYLFTALLALGYGLFCRKKAGSSAMAPLDQEKEEARE